MFVVVKFDTYGCDYGSGSIDDIFGLFSTREEAEAAAKKLPDEYAVEYNVRQLTPLVI